MATVRQLHKIQSTDAELNRVQDHYRDILNPFLRASSESAAGSWIAVAPSSYLNGYVRAAKGREPRYRIDAGRVTITGQMTSTTAVEGDTLFVLPSGFRPAVELQFVVATSAGVATIGITHTGEVYLITGDTASVHLDCSFFAEA